MPTPVKKRRWKCPQCKKSFWFKPHQIESRKFCSRECQYAAKRKPEGPKRKPWVPNYPAKGCDWCSESFLPKSKSQRFCSQDCSTRNAQENRRNRRNLPIIEKPCENCGKVFKPRWGSAARFCSRVCTYAGQRGEKSAHWEGGRHVTSEGYVRVRAPEHPKAQRGGYVPEHRLVMEQQLGRYLESHESVHHINGNRSDNRPENLQLRKANHGSGVTLRCLDCGSHNVESVRL